MTDTLMRQLSVRFKDVENNILITDATLLDPRFKRFGFSEQNKADAAYRRLKQKDFDEKVARTKATGNSIAAGIVELDKYMQEPLLKSQKIH
ncbi:zinc finger bed domain-containing protein 1-like protein [Lasius niger]|uniref:Zinc finger bed domain-containing protein 1-like protein n=1 Tax=Lasius niger TaxID=67767 RepID=A0A0J7N2K7_LASNI|nr:zinc finger bed domain-containing protein 1-like protein [Lasius niger]